MHEKNLVTQIKQLVVNVRRDQQEGVIFPLAYDKDGRKIVDFGLLNSGGSRQFDIGSVIDRYSRQIAMTVMADFIFLGHSGTGSYALSSDKTSLFTQAIAVWVDIIQDTFNRYAVPRLFRVNGMDATRLPKLVHNSIQAPNLTELSDYITKLTGVGMSFLPDDLMETYLRGIAGLPQKSDDLMQYQTQQRELQQARLRAEQAQYETTPESVVIDLETKREALMQQRQAAAMMMAQSMAPDQGWDTEEEAPPVRKRHIPRSRLEQARRRRLIPKAG